MSTKKTMNNTKIALLIPCFNEAQTIGSVITNYQKLLPKNATIYVYDNNSTDNTRDIAKQHGAIIRNESKQGKGHVVRRMFSEVEADIYVLVDGDGTYDPNSMPQLINELITNKLDMVVGTRDATENASYRLGHKFGNKFFNKIVSTLFGNQFTDIFSGYRVFSRKFVKSFPCFASGFEIETEMSVHALEMNLATKEFATPYSARPAGSLSKLSTIKDGFKILFTIVKLLKQIKPLVFFLLWSMLLAGSSIILFIPIFIEYLATGLVPRMPTVMLVASLMLLGFMCFFSGIILESVAHARRQNNWLCYLAAPINITKSTHDKLSTQLEQH